MWCSGLVRRRARAAAQVLLAMVVAHRRPARSSYTHRVLSDGRPRTRWGGAGPGEIEPEVVSRPRLAAHGWPPSNVAWHTKRLAGSTWCLRPHLDLAHRPLLPLAARGHSRDGKRDDPQIVFGLICAADGCPVAVVFPGNTADPATVAAQVANSNRVSVSSNRLGGRSGMITSARINNVLKPMGWTGSAACARHQIAQAQEHARSGRPCSTSAICSNSPASTSPASATVLCRNPLLAEERAQAPELLTAHRSRVGQRSRAVTRARNRYAARQIGLRGVARSTTTWPSTSARHHRHEPGLGAQAGQDRRRSRARRPRHPHQPRAEQLEANAAVAAYKSLSRVERAFRSIKTVDMRPSFTTVPSGCAHVFLCMLAYPSDGTCGRA